MFDLTTMITEKCQQIMCARAGSLCNRRFFFHDIFFEHTICHRSCSYLALFHIVVNFQVFICSYQLDSYYTQFHFSRVSISNVLLASMYVLNLPPKGQEGIRELLSQHLYELDDGTLDTLYT